MPKLRATLVTPLTGSLAPFGQACAAGLTLWATHAADLPGPWTGIELDVRDAGPTMDAAMQAALATHPDVLFGPYGSHTMLAAARSTRRVIWNHGGATSRLSYPTFPHVINILSPASTYFVGTLQALRALDPTATTVVLCHSTTGFGRDVADGVQKAATELHFKLRSIAFKPQQATAITSEVPDADVLLVVGNFADEQALAPRLLTRPWRAAAFVGGGVTEVLTSIGPLREGLLGPAQWMPIIPIEPDEGPEAGWFINHYKKSMGGDPPYPATQAFAAGLIYARCLRDSGSSEEGALLAAARQLDCNTLYGRFHLDSQSGLQTGHQVLTVQWQNGERRVVWPPKYAERPLLLKSTG
ncbi:ABC transporter substrate-binding protein [Dictyobacter aurantiacus]|uniref:Leucine-binding protein domain-containing protein n=1 Tax=Dictyobacter aurantiacus TaxID=1936993 RepID=A0A401Z8D1_9CHLR|nr:ABC transporter substrate-binding protein [Dictyobacter aurantiacus]GCE03102.1 hypothetical protein KDAU_04310 [Dictyobacter aurantiacus]